MNIKIIAIHPKDLRNNPNVWQGVFEQEVKTFNPDLIHFQYWDTANTLSQLEVCRGKKLILTHHNQKNLLSHDWKLFDKIVVHTKKAKSILEEAGYKNTAIIQHGIDIEKFKYNENYDVNNRVLGYVGRIVPWKGLYEIAKIAKELNTKVICMGRVDKADYWQKLQEFKDVLDIRFDTPDDKQTDVYHEMGVYVGNSSDNIEEGPLGLLEAMACGIPVVTTPAGEAADIVKDGENGIIADFEDYESLKSRIRIMLEQSDKNSIRDKAWNTVRNICHKRMARNYEQLYYKTVFNDDLVSVVIPTYNRAETITKVLDAYAKQTYKPIEIIVVDDSPIDDTGTGIPFGGDDVRNIIFEWAKSNRYIIIKYLITGCKGYGLAQARNMGIFEAAGKYIVFSDDRFLPHEDAVRKFVEKIRSVEGKAAVFGHKGADKKSFVENFFIVKKHDIVNAGMFCERITEYGGMSQEIRERLLHQKFQLIYEPLAKATPLFGTHNRAKKRYEIYRQKLKLWKLRN